MWEARDNEEHMQYTQTLEYIEKLTHYVYARCTGLHFKEEIFNINITIL